MHSRLRWMVVGMVVVLTAAGCGSSSPRFTSHEQGEAASKEWPVHQLRGIASYYADEFNGRPTASGEVYDMHGLTAAHRTLPFNTRVKVTNQDNGRSVVVRVNDRGPFKDDRVIDLSLAAARQLGITVAGTATVSLEIVEFGTP